VVHADVVPNDGPVSLPMKDFTTRYSSLYVLMRPKECDSSKTRPSLGVNRTSSRVFSCGWGEVSSGALAALVALSVGCAHTPVAPDRTFENAIADDLPRGSAHRRGERELRYQLRWPPGTLVRVGFRAALVARWRCETCENARGGSQQPGGSSNDNRVDESEFIASGSGDTFVVSSGEWTTLNEVVFEFSPGPTEVLAEPRSLQARLTNEARKEAAAQASRDEMARQAAEKRAAIARALQDELDGKARCVAPDSGFSHIGRWAEDGIKLVYCDGTTVYRTQGTWKLSSIGLSGKSYTEFTSREQAAAQVSSHNCSVLQTDVWCRRAAQDSTALEARRRAFVAKFRQAPAWYVSQAKHACLSAEVPGAWLCAQRPGGDDPL
jgi:hypothetical protein